MTTRKRHALPPRNPIRIDSLDLRFDAPRSGWLPLSLRLGDFSIAPNASNVLNDPIEEFIDLAHFARRPRSGFRRVSIWEEPGGYAIDVKHLGPSELVMVSVFHSKAFSPPMNRAAMSVCADVVCRRNLLYSRVRTCLSVWAAAQTAEALRGWSERFSALTAEIQGLAEDSEAE